jgi:probable phosphoglycerate mutase
LILIRHGETEANVSGIWHGSADAPLTARGKRQVEATARRVAELHAQTPMDVFYVSPLARTRSTADVIAQAIGMDPMVDEGLREFSIGDWEGRSFQELREQEHLWDRWRADPEFAPPNGESPASFGRRVPQAVLALLDRHANKTVVAVTHGGVISTLLAQTLGGGLWDWVQWDPHNCAITILEWDGSRWSAVVVNDVSHLPADVIVALTAI